jgi:hypothetical protein
MDGMTVLERYVTPRDLPAGAQLPPGPKLPPFLQTVMFLTKRDFTAPRWQRRYGDVFAIHIAPAGHGIVLSNPEHIREVFAGSADTFPAARSWASILCCCSTRTPTRRRARRS